MRWIPHSKDFVILISAELFQRICAIKNKDNNWKNIFLAKNEFSCPKAVIGLITSDDAHFKFSRSFCSRTTCSKSRSCIHIYSTHVTITGQPIHMKKSCLFYSYGDLFCLYCKVGPDVNVSFTLHPVLGNLTSWLDCTFFKSGSKRNWFCWLCTLSFSSHAFHSMETLTSGIECDQTHLSDLDFSMLAGL
jgi:hypothetical protein